MIVLQAQPRVQLERGEPLVAMLKSVPLDTVATKAFASKGYVSEFINGKRAVPLDTARAFCEAAGCLDQFWAVFAEAEATP